MITYDRSLVAELYTRVYRFSQDLNRINPHPESARIAFIITQQEALHLWEASQAEPLGIDLTVYAPIVEADVTHVLVHHARFSMRPPRPPRPGEFWGRMCGISLVIEDPPITSR